jgi:hypothetical protein
MSKSHYTKAEKALKKGKLKKARVHAVLAIADEINAERWDAYIQAKRLTKGFKG